jgi:hypothetical protein
MVIKTLNVLLALANNSRTQLIRATVGAKPVASLTTMLAVDIIFI